MSKTSTPEFLNWLADRLVHVYKESPNVDFVLRLREIAAAPAPAKPPVQSVKAIKPLVWQDMTFMGVEAWHAGHPFGSYHVTYEDDCEFPFVCRPFPSGPSNYATADEAKAAAEADYRKKMGYALASPSAPEEWQDKGDRASALGFYNEIGARAKVPALVEIDGDSENSPAEALHALLRDAREHGLAIHWLTGDDALSALSEASESERSSFPAAKGDEQ